MLLVWRHHFPPRQKPVLFIHVFYLIPSVFHYSTFHPSKHIPAPPPPPPTPQTMGQKLRRRHCLMEIFNLREYIAIDGRTLSKFTTRWGKLRIYYSTELGIYNRSVCQINQHFTFRVSPHLNLLSISPGLGSLTCNYSTALANLRVPYSVRFEVIAQICNLSSWQICTLHRILWWSGE